MKIYFPNIYKLYNHSSVLREFLSAGHEIEDVFFSTPADFYHDGELEAQIRKAVGTGKYDFVFTINYWPVIARAVHECASPVPYVSWSYDSPLNLPVTETMDYENNIIFLFDRAEAEKFRRSGIPTVRHLPLAADFSCGASNSGRRNSFSYDVSFLGSLYPTLYGEVYASASPYAKGYLEAMLSAQQLLYGDYIADAMAQDDLIHGVSARQLSFLIAGEATRRDRIVLLSAISRRLSAGKVCAVTGSDPGNMKELLKDCKLLPPIDYDKEMPKFFMASKVNLNPPLHAIRSGINLRALDIIGTGSFLLSGYLPELTESFIPGEEIEVYYSLDEAVEKALWYTKNDSVREAVAARGYEKAIKGFSYRDRIEKIITEVKAL